MMRKRGISKPEEEENHGEDLEVKTLFGVTQELAGLFLFQRFQLKQTLVESTDQYTVQKEYSLRSTALNK